MLGRVSKLGPQVRSFYRKALKVIVRLEDDHQKIWYDYLQLKIEDNRGLKNDKKIKRLLDEADQELDWVISILEQKAAFINKSRPN